MKILLAVDGSPCSDVAVHEVAQRPWPAETEVHVVTVDAPYEQSQFKAASPTAFDKVVKDQRTQALVTLENAKQILNKKSPELKVSSSLLQGTPKEAIVAKSNEWQADMIVIGSHGHGVVRRFLLGSVSQHIVNNAECSVLVSRCRPQA